MNRTGGSSWLVRAGVFVFAFGLSALLVYLGFGMVRLRGVESQLRTMVAEQQNANVDTVRALRDRLDELATDLRTSRCALGAAAGINAYHEEEYSLAVDLYDRALICTPDDGQVLGLKAYSQFKAGELAAALETQRSGIVAAPEDAWGYFNLSRYLCAASEWTAADERLATAVSFAPEIATIAAEDQEYQRLCADRTEGA